MSRELFTVKHCFVLEGRGLVLVPEPAIDGDAISAGDSILIRRGDDSELLATVSSIEILSGRDADMHPVSTFAIVLPERFSRDAVPVGCSVWST